MVRFGTKWPSITSRCKTVPPPSSAAFASVPNCAKFADNIEGARSMTVAKAALLRSQTKLEYTRGLRDTFANLASAAILGRPLLKTGAQLGLRAETVRRS